MPLSQCVAHFTPVAVVDFPRRFMSELLPVELNEDPPAELCIINVVQDMKRFDQASEFQGTRETDEIRPVFDDDARVDFALCDLSQRAVIGLTIHAPDPGTADISQTRAELAPQEPEQTKDRIGICSGIGHDVCGIEFGLLLRKQCQDGEAVTQGSRHNRGPETRILVRQHIIPCDAPAFPEIPRIWPGVDSCPGDDEPQAICRGSLPIPQNCVIGSSACADTILAFAVASVSDRMKFWLTRDSQLRRKAG